MAASLWLHRILIGPLLSPLPPTTAHLIARILFWVALAWSVIWLAEPSPRQWLLFRIEVMRDGLRYSIPSGWSVQHGFAAWDEIYAVHKKASRTVLQLPTEALVIPNFVGDNERLLQTIQRHLTLTPDKTAEDRLARRLAVDAELLEQAHALIRDGHKKQAISLLQEQAGLDFHTAFDYVYSWADAQEQNDADSETARASTDSWQAWVMSETMRSIVVIAVIIYLVSLIVRHW